MNLFADGLFRLYRAWNELKRNRLKSTSPPPLRASFLKQTEGQITPQKFAIKPVLMALAGLLTLIFAFQFFLAAPSTEQQLEKFLSVAGFKETKIPTPLHKNGAIIYNDIALDTDAFSTIKTLSIYRDTFGNWSRIDIDGLYLTGEIQKDFTFNFAGLNPAQADLVKIHGKHAPVIDFKNARIALLSPSSGAVNLNFDLQLRPKDNTYEFQAKLDGSNSQLSYSANAQGVLGPDHKWTSKLDIEQAKFSLGQLKATRLSGDLTVSGDGISHSKILGEFRAGGLTVIGLPWQNAMIAIDGSASKTRMALGARSAGGAQELELNLALDSLQNPKIYSGTLHADTLGALFDYLQTSDLLPFKRKTLSPLDAAPSIDIAFRGHNSAVVFDIDQPAMTTQGKIEATDPGAGFKDLAKGLPFLLTLQSPEQSFEGTVELSEDRASLIAQPSGKTVKPRLKENSTLIDIFKR